MGVALDIVATPPLIDKAKSPTSSAPLPPLVLYTVSLMVTATVALSAATATDEMVAANLSFKFAVLPLWVVLDSLPTASYMPSSVGTTASTSLPFGVPVRPMPSVYTFPLTAILVGVALDKVATPPLIDKEKSPTSSAPLPPLVLYTVSLMVTATVALSAATATDEMVAAN